MGCPSTPQRPQREILIDQAFPRRHRHAAVAVHTRRCGAGAALTLQCLVMSIALGCGMSPATTATELMYTPQFIHPHSSSSPSPSTPSLLAPPRGTLYARSLIVAPFPPPSFRSHLHAQDSNQEHAISPAATARRLLMSKGRGSPCLVQCHAQRVHLDEGHAHRPSTHPASRTKSKRSSPFGFIHTLVAYTLWICERRIFSHKLDEHWVSVQHAGDGTTHSHD